MNARRSISKRLRFEIFKRDRFACVYCGAESPDAKLRVDHVCPVARGGNNAPANLVTACNDCNAGKSDVELDDRYLMDGAEAVGGVAWRARVAFAARYLEWAAGFSTGELDDANAEIKGTISDALSDAPEFFLLDAIERVRKDIQLAPTSAIAARLRSTLAAWAYHDRRSNFFERIAAWPEYASFVAEYTRRKN